MLAFYQPGLASGSLFLSEEDSRHCIRVLRLTKGSQIEILDGNGSRAVGEITEPNPVKVLFKILKKEPKASKDFFIHLAIAPTKNHERIEWCLEKCTEIGVDKISLISTHNSERIKIRKERLEKKIISALKQAHNLFMPQIQDLMPVTELIKNCDEQQKFICSAEHSHANTLLSKAIKGSSYCILVGPEGDFTEQELRIGKVNGFEMVSLGKNTLRTETAGIYCTTILNSINS